MPWGSVSVVTDTLDGSSVDSGYASVVSVAGVCTECDVALALMVSCCVALDVDVWVCSVSVGGDDHESSPIVLFLCVVWSWVVVVGAGALTVWTGCTEVGCWSAAADGDGWMRDLGCCGHAYPEIAVLCVVC